MNILVLHGPNLNLLGEREPAIYGHQTLADIDQLLVERAEAAGASLKSFQSNHEGALIDRLHDERRWMAGLVINAGGLTHTSVSLRDAVSAVGHPAVEVHLSNTQAREPFRHTSLLTDVCIAKHEGKGVQSYLDGLDALLAHLERRTASRVRKNSRK